MADALNAGRLLRSRLATLRPLGMAFGLVLVVLLFLKQQSMAQLFAGVALFLLGMRYLEDGFRAFTGGALERWLAASTDRLWKSLAFGTVSTALVQSSSLITLLCIAFLSAGLISLTAGIGIVFGANLGTTTGAWLIALVGLKVDLAQVGMPLLVLGDACVALRLSLSSSSVHRGAATLCCQRWQEMREVVVHRVRRASWFDPLLIA